MENNILTNRAKASALFNWTNRKYLSVSIAYWILLFMVYPLIEIFLMLVSKKDKFGNSYYHSRMENFGMDATMILFVGVAISYSIIMCLIAFSYMHNKRCMDMFGSLPLSKRAVFFSRLISVVVTTIIPVIVIGMIGAVLTLDKTMALTQIKNLIILIVALLGNIGFMAVISLCCGTTIDTLICYMAINVAYPIALALCVYYPYNIIPGMEQGEISGNIYTLLSPIASAYTGIYFEGKKLYIVWWLIFSVIMIILCSYLCKKRKAESAQSNFAFGMVEIGIKFLAAFVAGMTAGILFGALGYAYSGTGPSYIWLVCGVLLGVFIAEFMLHLIFHRGLNCLKNSLKQGVIVVGAIGIFFLIIFTGAMGFDKKIPDAKNVEAVKVEYRYADTFMVRGQDLINTYESDKDTINEAIKIHKAIVDNVKKNKYKGMFYHVNRDYYSVNSQAIGTRIKYKLKNGKTITRTYNGGEIPNNQVESIEKLVSDEKDILEAIPTKCIVNINVWSDNKDIEYDCSDNEKCAKIVEAMMQDGRQVTKIKDTSDTYSIDVFYTDTGSNKDFKSSYSRTYVIYKEYKNTIKVLKELGALD